MREIEPQSGDPLREGQNADARLSVALRGLAAASHQGAPAEVGAGLATAFRRHHARHRLLRRVSIAALAACLALTIGLMSLRLRHEAPAKEIVKEQPSGVPARVPEIVTLQKAAATTPRPVKRHLKAKAANNIAASRRQFLALPGYDPGVPARLRCAAVYGRLCCEPGWNALRREISAITKSLRRVIYESNCYFAGERIAAGGKRGRAGIGAEGKSAHVHIYAG
jgi:hypothetical protein